MDEWTPPGLGPTSADEAATSGYGPSPGLSKTAKVLAGLCAVFLIVALSVAGTLAVAGGRAKRESVAASPTTTTAAVERSTTTSVVTTTTTTSPPTTSAAPTTQPTQPRPSVTQPPTPQVTQPYVPPVTCVTGSIDIRNIAVRVDETGYDDYVITADLVNGTNVIWDTLGVALSVSDATYPDREADTVSMSPATEEIRPGESIPMEGHFGFLSAAPPKIGRVWWDPAYLSDPNRSWTYPRIDGDWKFC